MSQHIDPVMTQASVVDNLTTNDATKVLSAKQGKNLKDQIPGVVNNLTSDSTTPALSAAQGKALNSKIAHIDTSTKITSLDSIPLNSKGRIYLGASVSPSGSDGYFNYICYGNTDKITLKVNIPSATTGNDKEYRCSNNNGTWSGWYSIDNVFPEKMQFVKLTLANGTAKTFELPETNTIFAIIVSRSGVASTSAEGILIGGSGSTNSHISPIGTAPSNLTYSISGKTISLTSSTTNQFAIIIYA